MIFNTLIIFEIVIVGVIGWFFNFNKFAEPPQITPLTPIVINETPLAKPPQPALQSPTQTIIIPSSTSIHQGASLLSTTTITTIEIPLALTPTLTSPLPQTIYVPIPKIPITTPEIPSASISAPTPPTPPTPPPVPTPSPQTIYIPIYITQPSIEPTPLLIQLPKSMTTIKIISPIAGKGLGRIYTAQPQIVDETNYIELGLIVRDDAGEPIKNAVVIITATDDTQNKTLNGTGDVLPQYENEVRIITPFYPFHYEFKTVGDHTITFSVNDITDSVTLTVVAPDPV